MTDPTPQQPADDQTPPPAPPAAPAYPPPPAYAPSAAPQPGAYPPPAYPQAPAPGYGYPAGPRTNTLAIVSLVAGIASFVILPLIAAVVAVITGHMSLKQLKTSGEAGRGLALTGTILGWVGIGVGLIVVVLVVVWFVFLFGVIATSGYSYS